MAHLQFLPENQTARAQPSCVSSRDHCGERHLTTRLDTLEILMLDFDVSYPIEGGPVPLVPLPNTFLIPGAVVALNVAGPQYKPLVDSVLDTNGFVVVGTFLGKKSAEGASPDVQPVGSLGHIEDYQWVEDERAVLMVRGLSRVYVGEAPFEGYRRATFQIAAEEPVPDTDRDGLESELREALARRVGASFYLPAGLRIGQLTDLLLMHLRLAPERMNEVFCLTEVSARARKALAEDHRA